MGAPDDCSASTARMSSLEEEEESASIAKELDSANEGETAVVGTACLVTATTDDSR